VIGATGANTSSVYTGMSGVTPVSTVGRKNSPSWRPPSTTVAPARTESSIRRTARSPLLLADHRPEPDLAAGRVADLDRLGPGGERGHVPVGDPTQDQVPARGDAGLAW